MPRLRQTQRSEPRIQPDNHGHKKQVQGNMRWVKIPEQGQIQLQHLKTKKQHKPIYKYHQVNWWIHWCQIQAGQLHKNINRKYGKHDTQRTQINNQQWQWDHIPNRQRNIPREDKFIHQETIQNRRRYVEGLLNYIGPIQ